MRILYYLDSDQVPSPGLVAAWAKIEDLATERIPFWAAHWIADGMDGNTLRILAGLDGSDPHEARDNLVAALAGTRTLIPQLPEAIMIVCRDLAQLHLDGKISARQLIVKVTELVNARHSEDFLDQPLGKAYYLDYEWTCGHCRMPDELTTLVHEACLAQLGQQQDPRPSG